MLLHYSKLSGMSMGWDFDTTGCLETTLKDYWDFAVTDILIRIDICVRFMLPFHRPWVVCYVLRCFENWRTNMFQRTQEHNKRPRDGEMTA